MVELSKIFIFQFSIVSAGIFRKFNIIGIIILTNRFTRCKPLWLIQIYDRRIGIYTFYWAYKCGEKLDKAKADRGMQTSGLGVVYLILCIFGLGIVAYALIQNELNSLA